MKTRKFFYPLLTAVSLFVAVACSDDDDPKVNIETSDTTFVILAREGADAQSTDQTYLIQSAQVNSGEVSASNARVATDGQTPDGSFWVFPGDKNAYNIAYSGAVGTYSSYSLGTDSLLFKNEKDFNLTESYGSNGYFDEKVIVLANQRTITDKTQYPFVYVDTKTETNSTAKTDVSSIKSGEKDTVQFAGVAQVGNKFYSGLFAGDNVNDNIARVAIFDKDFKLEKVISNNKTGYISGRFRSFYHNMLAVVGNYVYAFSPSYASTLPSGVLRVNTTTGEFDTNYFFDVQAKAETKIYKAMHITGDYFLLQMYNEGTSASMAIAKPVMHRLAVVNVESKSFNWVSGVPEKENITRIGNTSCQHDGKILITITTNSDRPYVYSIDPTTATATKGAKIVADDALGIGKLTI